MVSQDLPSTFSLDGLYEPSAVQQLSDGRFLVVEDEKRQPFSVFTLDPAGKVQSRKLRPSLFNLFSSAWKLDDLEGLTMDRTGLIYAITSHSRDGQGNEKGSREKLIRFEIDGHHTIRPRLVGDLKQVLTKQYAVLAEAAAMRDVKGAEGLNIEALEFDPQHGHLLIGFRSPLIEGRALVARLVNPAAVFESGAKVQLAPTLDELDLDGRGIRGLSYMPSLNAYLVISGPVTKADGGFGLWLWEGLGKPARSLQVPPGIDLARAEGLGPARVNGLDRVIVVHDDGDRGSGRSASARLLDPGTFIPA